MTDTKCWRFAVRACRNGAGFIAWCAKSDDLANGPLEVDATEEVHFEFGPTADEALGRLKRSVLS